MNLHALRGGRTLLRLAVLACLSAPLARADAPALTDSLRLDPRVRTGTLPNGMRYYIRRNPKPEARLSLRLVVGVGSTSETDAQRGIAHFSEHMNFDGSKHFAPQELVSYLESIGMRFGSDANAYTSFDETVYMLEVPTDRDTLLDRGLTALADFAGAATFDTAQVRKERRVVIEEWRLGRGADERMSRKTDPVVYHGSRYALRNPIGKPEVIRGTPTSRIRDFYDHWYTPERMAVVAVGDVDPARLDSLVRVHFSAIGHTASPATSAPFPIPLHPETLIGIATDREATDSDVEVLFKHPRRPLHTVSDFRRALAEQLYSAMLDERFSEIAHRPNPPFLDAESGSGDLGRTLDLFSVSATVDDGGLARGLATLMEELQRVRRFGFLPAELERARENLRQQDASRYAEREKQESGRLAARYVNVFLTGEPSIGAEKGHELVTALLDGITLDDVQALTPQLIHDDSRVVLMYAPAKKGVAVPTEAQVRAILTRSAATKVTAWHEQATRRSLMEQPPVAGTIVGRRTLAPLGVTILQLSNGVEVWLKPTDFKADEILIGGEAMGGLSLADSTAWQPAWASGWALSQGGVGGLNSTALEKVLTGKLVAMQTWSGDYTHGVSGRARPADLETALQLLYLRFTAPTRDTVDFANTMRNAERWYANRRNDPEQVFRDTVTIVNSGDFWMDRPIEPRAIGRIPLDSVLAVHRRRYANAADFTFFVVGAFDVDSIAPLLARYVGALPSAGRATSAFRPRAPHEPIGTRTMRLRLASEPKTQTVITFFTASPIEELDMHRARACASILEERLRRALRERLGGTYGASVEFTNRAPLPGHAEMTVEFGCEPSRLDSMVAATLAEVRRFRQEGPTAAELKNEQEIERRELEVSEKQNGTWLSLLSNFHEYGWDPLRIPKRRERIEALTTDNLRATAAKYLPPDRYTVLSLLPRTP